MSEGRFDIISVDFENKKKVDRYIEVNWYCIVCYKMFKYDSREIKNIQRIIVNDNLELRNENCICQNCAVKIKEIVEDQKWN